MNYLVNLPGYFSKKTVAKKKRKVTIASDKSALEDVETSNVINQMKKHSLSDTSDSVYQGKSKRALICAQK